MPAYNGTIKKDYQSLIEDIHLWLEEVKDSRSGLRNWYGSFSIPHEKNIEPGGLYRLTLEDGRSGDIIISNVQIDENEVFIRFMGTGPLK
ncbi:MAG: hypothetical protein AB1500_11165 [Bacillota bacterium]